MELKDFIAASLEGIADGIIESSIRLSDKGFIVSPSIGRVNDRSTEHISLVHDIEFNVFVEESNEIKGEGKAGIQVFSAGINNKKEGKQGTSLSFKIPVIYPQNYFLLSEKTFEHLDDKEKCDNNGYYKYKDV
jgi:hypothetical protein|nr:MAG TPA: hypothetical protein [Caudoviricetes sp.]